MLRNTYVSQLRIELEEISSIVLDLLNISSIKKIYKSENPYYAFSTEPRKPPEFVYAWDKLTSDQERTQINVENRFTVWYKRFCAVAVKFFQERELIAINNSMRSWIAFRHGYTGSLPSTREDAKQSFGKDVQAILSKLDELEKYFIASIILIPDTNALIVCPDIGKFTGLVGNEKCTVIIFSTVIGELDKLKMQHSDKEFGKKVSSVISRIKGWRNQGNILNGVTINKTITLKILPIEPMFDETVYWLDPSNNDDRIIAMAVNVQREYPTSSIILVTQDLNLQTKAELAHVTYLEPPKTNGG